MKIKLEHLILALVVMSAAFLYFYKLDKIPNSLSDDEATVGYNAYSIMTTGRDEFGKPFPLAFRFFGAYTPPLYVYLVIPSIKLFGLTASSLRVLFGIATLVGVLVIYRFVRKLALFTSPATALLAAFIFAISPWIIFYARIGYEVTFGYLLYSLGALFVWEGLDRRKLSMLGLVLLSLSTYVAHAERYLVPLFLFVISIFFRKELFSKTNQKRLLIGAVILLLTQIPNFFLMTTKAFWVKNATFDNPSLMVMVNDFVSQLLTYLSPRALFGISPDINLQHTAPEIPLFYSWLIIPFLIGLYQVYLKARTTGGKFLLIFLLTAPIPGAFSGHFISIQRVLPMIVPLILIIALGLDFILQRVRLMIFLPIFFLLTAFSLLLFWRSYWVLFPKERAAYWSYGVEQLSEIVRSKPETTFVIDTARAPTTYIGFLFYLKYPPAEYQKQFSPEFVKRYYTNSPLAGSYKLANIELRPVEWKRDIYVKQILVGDELTISSDQAKEHFLERVFEIKDPNGKPILIGYRTNPQKKRSTRGNN